MSSTRSYRVSCITSSGTTESPEAVIPRAQSSGSGVSPDASDDDIEPIRNQLKHAKRTKGLLLRGCSVHLIHPLLIPRHVLDEQSLFLIGSTPSVTSGLTPDEPECRA